MTTQEKLQAIINKLGLTCIQATFFEDHFLLGNSDRILIADFNTYDCKASSFYDDNGYALMSNEKLTAIEQEWLKVIDEEESEGVAVTNNDIKWGIDQEVFAEIYSQRMAT